MAHLNPFRGVRFRVWPLRSQCGGFPDPLKDPKNGTSPQNEPVTTLGNLGDYEGGPFFGSFRGSGLNGQARLVVQLVIQAAMELLLAMLQAVNSMSLTSCQLS